MATCWPAAALRPVKYMAPSMRRIPSGNSTVENLKARPRICCRYSRLAMRRTLRIGLASHGLDEYLFKRGLDQLETINRRHGRGLVEQLLRVAVRFELDLRVAGEVFGLGDLVAIQEIRASLKLDDHVVALI